MRLLQLQDNNWGSRKSEAEGASKLFSDSSQKATEEKKVFKILSRCFNIKCYTDVIQVAHK